MSSPVKNAILLVASVLVGLTLAELGIRAYFWTRGIGRRDVRQILQRARHEGPIRIRSDTSLYGLIQASDHDDIVYELKPHLEGIFKKAEIGINSHGFRGPEVSVKKPEGTLRVVGIGDSHMFGWGVGQEQFYLAVLERLLDERAVGGRRWQALNFGVPGYNTEMEVATLEHRALAFDPDIVVLHFVGNDIYPPHFLQAPRGAAPSQWYLVELVRGIVGPPEDEPVEPPGEEKTRRPSRRERRRSNRQEFDKPNLARALRHLATLSREHEFQVIVMMLGDGGRLRARVRERAESHDLRVLNAAPFWWRKLEEMGFEQTRRNWHRRLANGVDRHPRPAAHEAYAEALAHEIAGLVEAGPDGVG